MFKKLIIISFFMIIINGFPTETNKLFNPEEDGEYFEGDMILNSEQLNAIMSPIGRNALIKDKYKWPNNTVFYEIDKIFDDPHREYILKGLRELELKTCIRFYPRTNLTTDYIYVTGNPGGCNSKIGYQGGKQILNLAIYDLEQGCFRKATICHEFIHALGFYHQQSASNRDLYVKIIEDNIKPEKLSNFILYNSSVVTDFGIEYDYGSVMHYSAFAFSKNGEKTIVPLKENVEIGQRTKLSDKDILKLNLMYKCNQMEKN